MVADSKKGYWTTMAPLIVRNHVIVGVSAATSTISRAICALSIPRLARRNGNGTRRLPAGTPNATTGGMTWMTGTYDPDAESVLLGHGQSDAGAERQDAARATTCIPAASSPSIPIPASLSGPSSLRRTTRTIGMPWKTPVLVDADFHGQPRKMLMQTSRNGYFFVLDRTNGKNLLTAPFGPVNWTLGVDKEGRPIPNPAKEPAPDGRLIAPDEGGMTNYPLAQFRSQDRTVYR